MMSGRLPSLFALILCVLAVALSGHIGAMAILMPLAIA